MLLQSYSLYLYNPQILGLITNAVLQLIKITSLPNVCAKYMFFCYYFDLASIFWHPFFFVVQIYLRKATVLSPTISSPWVLVMKSLYYGFLQQKMEWNFELDLFSQCSVAGFSGNFYLPTIFWFLDFKLMAKAQRVEIRVEVDKGVVYQRLESKISQVLIGIQEKFLAFLPFFHFIMCINFWNSLLYH